MCSVPCLFCLWALFSVILHGGSCNRLSWDAREMHGRCMFECTPIKPVTTILYSVAVPHNWPTPPPSSHDYLFAYKKLVARQRIKRLNAKAVQY